MTIQRLDHTDAAFPKEWRRLCDRRPLPGSPAEAGVNMMAIEAGVAEILTDVNRGGDEGVIDAARRLDGFAGGPGDLEVSLEERRAGAAKLDPDVQRALDLMAERIRAFHERQLDRGYTYTDSVGDGAMQLGQRVTPLKRVGIYVPGGRAVYPSSLLMNAVPARVAGVEQVVAITPQRGPALDPAVLHAADLARVDRLFRVGGAHGVAALAFGTETFPRVDKIVGPGNIYVSVAKRQLWGRVDIDGFAGPSEVLIVADASAPPAYVAADLMSQAEHDPMALCVAVCVGSDVADAVAAAVGEAEAPADPGQIAVVTARDRAQAVTLSEELAPEHLQVMVEDPDALLPDLRSAGTIFVGPECPTALGDYLAGANHVLPTGGSARFGSPLGVYDFVKRTNVVRCDAPALSHLSRDMELLAEREGLPLHARSVRLRRES